jgi:hypothetical protein
MNNSRIYGALTGLGVLFSFVPAALAAEGDPCVEDADCGEGYQCDLPPTASGMSSGATDSGGSAKVAPPDASGGMGAGGAGSEVVREGTCERAPKTCTTDADCDEYYVCEFGDSVETICVAGGSCSETDTAPVEESGFCEAELIACSKNAECPSGTECVDGTCTLDLTSCEEDSDCDSGYECLSSREQDCSSTPPCAGTGGACEPEIVCEPSGDATSFCFPKAKACDTDDDCTGSWRCYDMEDEEDAPEDWAGVDKGCLPPELVGAIEGYVQVTLDGVAMGAAETSDSRSSDLEDGSDDDDDDDDAADAPPAENDEAEASGAPKEDGSAGATDRSAGTNKSNGCTWSGSGSARTSLFGMVAMALLGAAALRRRAS